MLFQQRKQLLYVGLYTIVYIIHVIKIIRYYCRRFSSNAHIIQRSSVIPKPFHRAVNIIIKPSTRIVLFHHLNT